jgi:hypothetical protein
LFRVLFYNLPKWTIVLHIKNNLRWKKLGTFKNTTIQKKRQLKKDWEEGRVERDREREVERKRAKGEGTVDIE